MISEPQLQHVKQAVTAASRHWLVRTEGTGISIYEADGRPLARLRCLGEAGWEVRRPTATGWTHIGVFGGEAYEQLADAIHYVLTDPMGILGAGKPNTLADDGQPAQPRSERGQRTCERQSNVSRASERRRWTTSSPGVGENWPKAINVDRMRVQAVGLQMHVANGVSKAIDDLMTRESGKSRSGSYRVAKDIIAEQKEQLFHEFPSQ